MHPSLIPATSKPLQWRQGSREVPICDRWTQRRNRVAQSAYLISVAGGRDDSAVVPEAVEDRRGNGGVSNAAPACATTRIRDARSTRRPEPLERLTLALAAFGLISIIDSLGSLWSSLVTTLLLALSARVLFAVAQRSPDKRFAWLLSASVAAGLTIADTYATASSALPQPGAPSWSSASHRRCSSRVASRGNVRAAGRGQRTKQPHMAYSKTPASIGRGCRV